MIPHNGPIHTQGAAHARRQNDVANATQPSAPPGWYADPWGVAPARWWDGGAWTPHTAGRPGTAYPPPRIAYARPGTAYAPPARPRARDDLRGGGIALAGFFGGQVLGLALALLGIAAGARARTVPVLVLGQIGLWTGLLAAVFVVVRRRPGGSFADLGFFRPDGDEIGIGIAVGFGGLFVAGFVAAILRHFFPGVGGTPLVPAHVSYAYATTVAVLACVGAPVIEELFFRGVVQSVLTRTLGTAAAIVAQAVLFALAHFQLGMSINDAIVKCGTVMVLGLVLGWMRAHTGRLGTGMFAHATNNTIVTLLSFALLASHAH